MRGGCPTRQPNAGLTPDARCTSDFLRGPRHPPADLMADRREPQAKSRRRQSACPYIASTSAASRKYAPGIGSAVPNSTVASPMRTRAYGIPTVTPYLHAHDVRRCVLRRDVKSRLGQCRRSSASRASGASSAFVRYVRWRLVRISSGTPPVIGKHVCGLRRLVSACRSSSAKLDTIRRSELPS